MRHPGRPGWRQLFDLRNDPLERRNLAGDPASQGVLRAMGKALDAELAATRYPAPVAAGPPP